jgi:hypothetical protein
MNEELEMIKLETESLMKKAITHLEAELVKIRAGKANPNMLDGIVADYYGLTNPYLSNCEYIRFGCPYHICAALGKKDAAAHRKKQLMQAILVSTRKTTATLFACSCHLLLKKEERNW